MDKIDEILTRGVTNIIPSKDKLKDLLNTNKKLNVYLGIDPTSTKIHLGNAVPLKKLQQFVELGHNVTFLIGDFTALIGDASDKESERPILTYNQIKENFKTYKKQASKLLDFSKVKVKYNSLWLKNLSFKDIVELCQLFSLNDFIGRELIKKRLEEGKSVRLDEVLYPVMQGYDSYFLDTDIQIGGADQTFNMQAGRILQEKLQGKESYIIVTGYLEGTDGRKMSKSWGNAIWLEDEPNDMFGKLMSIPDSQIIPYMELVSDVATERVKEVKQMLNNGNINPLEAKKEMAYKIVAQFHSEPEAEKAKENFEKTFQKGEMPEKLEVTRIRKGSTILDVLSKVVGSKSEAKRLLSQSAIDVDRLTISNPNHKLKGGEVIKIGKKRFVKTVS